MGKRYCTSCKSRHATPTGKNCKHMREMERLRAEEQIPDGARDAPIEDAGAFGDDNLDATQGVVSDRLDRLEEIITQISEKLATDVPTRGRSPAGSDISDLTEDERRRRRRKNRSPSKSRDRYGYDNVFLDEDFAVKSFEGVMLALFKTCSDFLEDGLDLAGLIEHGQLLAEKATAGVYVSDAFVGYDKYVRSLAGRKGPEMFGHTSEIIKSRFFNLENHKDVRALRAKTKSAQKTGTCRRFNTENGCFIKSCPYVHRCAGCEIYGHAIRDCKVTKKDKDDK